MIKLMAEVKVGDRVWSDLIDEYFTVQSLIRTCDRTTLYDGIFSLRGLNTSKVEVAND